MEKQTKCPCQILRTNLNYNDYIVTETFYEIPEKLSNFNQSGILETTCSVASSADQPASPYLSFLAASVSCKFSTTNVSINRRKKREQLEEK